MGRCKDHAPYIQSLQSEMVPASTEGTERATGALRKGVSIGEHKWLTIPKLLQRLASSRPRENSRRFL